MGEVLRSSSRIETEHDPLALVVGELYLLESLPCDKRICLEIESSPFHSLRFERIATLYRYHPSPQKITAETTWPTHAGE